jgi:hypothetical protein
MRPTLRTGLHLALGLAVAAVAGRAHASARGLRAPAQRIVAFDPPPGWERAATPPSSRLLGTWSHRDGGRLTLAAERVAAGVTAQRLFDDSKPALAKQGWTLGKVEAQPMRVVADATLDGGKRVARQLYLVEEGFAYVITLVAPVEQRADHARDFDEAVGSLKLGAADER